MSAHKFTPGPWAVGAGYGPHGVRIDAGSRAICGVIGVTRDAYNPDGSGARPVDTPDGWANARLIAAAPELLDALCDALIVMEASAEVRHGKGWTAVENSPIAKARAAIAKATGESA